MENTKRSLFRGVDCVQLYASNLQEGIDYYCNGLGLKMIWKTDSAAGLGLDESVTEVVIQNKRQEQEIDFKVDSVVEAIVEIQKAGGQIVYGPFDIQIGKCAVVEDPWKNKYTILDATKGTFVTDKNGNIVGQNSPSKKHGTF
jgi:lactoylglutathione lyase